MADKVVCLHREICDNKKCKHQKPHVLGYECKMTKCDHIRRETKCIPLNSVSKMHIAIESAIMELE